MLTEKRKADREAMAIEIASLWGGEGFKATIIPSMNVYPGKRCIMVDLEGPHGLRVSPRFNGDSWQPDTFVLSWHMSTNATAKLAGIFDSVNPIHRHKATDIAEGFEDLKRLLTIRRAQLQDGSAFL